MLVGQALPVESNRGDYHRGCLGSVLRFGLLRVDLETEHHAALEYNPEYITVRMQLIHEYLHSFP